MVEKIKIPNKNVDKEKQKTTPLYSKEEIKDFVKGFLDAYICGKIEVIPPKGDSGKQFNKAILICSGESSATQKEIEKAISDIYATIIGGRQGGQGYKRIQGEFNKSDVDERLLKLEKDSIKNSDVLEQLQSDFKDFKDQLDFFKKGMKQ